MSTLQDRAAQSWQEWRRAAGLSPFTAAGVGRYVWSVLRQWRVRLGLYVAVMVAAASVSWWTTTSEATEQASWVLVAAFAVAVLDGLLVAVYRGVRKVLAPRAARPQRAVTPVPRREAARVRVKVVRK